MPTPYAQLLENLKAAQGDTGKLALITFDFAVQHDPVLKAAAEVAAIPHWFDAASLAALLPEHAEQADCLVEQLRALPMVEPYDRNEGEPAWNIHEATRLALRDRLWQQEPERFRLLSARAAETYGTADPKAADFVSTCEHVYHQLAAQTETGDAAMEGVAGDWRGDFRFERLQTLTRLLEELLAAKPAPPLLPRGLGLSYQAIAIARESHQPAPATHTLLVQAEVIFRELAASDPANAVWQRDLFVSLDKLGALSVAQGDLAEALRYFTESKTIAERLAASDPANAGWQRDLFVSLNKLGDLAGTQGDLVEALRYFTESKNIAEGLAAIHPASANRQRDLSVSLNKLGELAVAQGDLVGTLRYFTEDKAIAERLAATDPANTGWQRDLLYSCWVISRKVFQPQERWAEALELMEQSLSIATHIAAMDRTNVTWQKDERVCRALVEELRAKVAEL